MINAKFHRRKTILMTLSLFFLCFMLVLNVMVNQLQSSNALEQIDFEVKEASKLRNGQRNPMAAANSDSDNINYVNQKSHQAKKLFAKKSVFKKFTIPHQNRNRIIDLQGINHHRNTNQDADDEEESYYDDYDIEKVVIEDDGEDDDDDDDEDDYDDDTANNKHKMPEDKNAKSFNSFDIRKNKTKLFFTKPPLKYRDVPYQGGVPTMLRTIKSGQGLHTKRTQGGIYWSLYVESLVPKGMTMQKILQYIHKVRKLAVKTLDPPAWNKCGRPKNGFVTLQDGSFMCARYREPHNKMVLGEVLSFYLSRMLGMDNVPAVVLSSTNHSSPQWRSTDFSSLKWKENKIVALIQWIADMDSYSSLVQIPNTILQAYEAKTVIDHKVLESSNLTDTELTELVQWGSMIIFDYLTGNYDRIASMQDAALKEKKPSILLENIRNLRKSTTTDKMWLIDNESGLLDAYDLMYNNVYGGEKFIKFHKDMLQTFCVFQKSLVTPLIELNESQYPHSVLEQYAVQHDSLIPEIPKDKSFLLFQTVFKDRVREVTDWIKLCSSKLKR